jgi:alkylation response protein AidB-like acyl-CoA dehydrogenase
MTPERPAIQILSSEYEMLRTTFRRFADDLPELDPATPLDLTVLRALALGDLLSDNGAAEPDVDWLAWLVAFEELGPSPIGTGLLASVGFGAGLVHLLAGASSRAAELKEAALSGEGRLALAIQEPGPRWAYGDYSTKAVGTGKTAEPRLEGSKIKVAHASAADTLLVVATREGAAHVYAVDLGAEGVTVIDEPTVEPGLAVSVVQLDDAPAVRVSGADPADSSIVRALSFAKLAMAALCVGGASRALDLAVDYMQDRRQFGQSLREFQAVSHRCGRSRVRLEQMRALVYRAALEGAHADQQALHHSAAIARTFCADGYASIAAEAMRAEGAIGITWENALGGHYRRAYWLRDLLGGQALERRLILDEALRLSAG